MSRAAGTLVTTHNATYVPPRYMPGYQGFCPTVHYDYGETYGNATSKYFQDYRSKVLNCSGSEYAKGGNFPTYYTHNPDLVISERSRTWDRWLSTPPYALTNTHYDRMENLHQFNELAQAHREHYSDKSDTVSRVDYFLLPKTAEEQFKKKAKYLNQPIYVDVARTPKLPPFIGRSAGYAFRYENSTKAERRMRDMYFER